MAHPVQYHNPQTNASVTAFEGFSWTSLFFGCIPALFRADLILFVITACICVFTAGLGWIIMPFCMNPLQRKLLEGRGFERGVKAITPQPSETIKSSQ